MNIYLYTQSGKSIGGYEADIIPRTGEWVRFEERDYKILIISHRIKNTVGTNRLNVVDITVGK